MEHRTNTDKIKALKQAKEGIDKEKADIKEELKKLGLNNNITIDGRGKLKRTQPKLKSFTTLQRLKKS